MNVRQRRVLWLGILLMGMMGLFPPWQVTVYRMPWEVRGADVEQLTVTYRYRFVADPPVVRLPRVRHVVFGWSRLRYQWMLVSLVTLFLLMFLRDRPRGGDSFGGDGSGRFSPDDPVLEPGRRPVHA